MPASGGAVSDDQEQPSACPVYEFARIACSGPAAGPEDYSLLSQDEFPGPYVTEGPRPGKHCAQVGDQRLP